MTDPVREIMPVVFFGPDDRLDITPTAPSGDAMVERQLQTARRRDFRPRPVPVDAPDIRRTKIVEDEAGDVTPKDSSAIESASDSSVDSTPNQSPESLTSSSAPPEETAPAARESTPTLRPFDPLANL